MKKGQKVSQLKARAPERKVTRAESTAAFQVLAWGPEREEQVWFPFWEWLPQRSLRQDQGTWGRGRQREAPLGSKRTADIKGLGVPQQVERAQGQGKL